MIIKKEYTINLINSEIIDGKNGIAKNLAQNGWKRKIKNNDNNQNILLSQLHRIKWHRVILDEAHLISNSKTKRYKACYQLRSKYRWCITGT